MTAQMLTTVVLIGGLGLPVGWFLTVVILRMTGPTAVAPPLPMRYPLMVVGTGIFFALVTWWELAGPGRTRTDAAPPLEAGLVLLAFLYLAAVSVVLTVIDINTHTLPDRVPLPSYLFSGVLLAAAAIGQGDVGRLAGAGVGMVSLGFFYFLLAMLSPGGMGFGDVKLAGLLGLYLGWLGWEQLLVGAVSAFLFGGAFALILLATGRVGRRGGIPFGPWMFVGAWVGILLGEVICAGYLGPVGLA